MRILVTGGTGFTGKALVRRLLDEGHEVVALDYKEGVKTEELHQWGARVVIGSVTDRDVVDRCMDGVEVVHHLAAAFRELDVPDTYYQEVNVQGHGQCAGRGPPGGGEKVHLLQHLRRSRQRRPAAGGRDRPHQTGGLLPADQIRGRTPGEGV